MDHAEEKPNSPEMSILIQQWQTCVEMANTVSQRRDTMNNLFVTLNLALTAAISLLWDVKTLSLLISGIILCILWTHSIENFKHLNAEKFRVIFLLEERMTLQPFQREWDYLQFNKKYQDGTKLESWLPKLFIGLYIVITLILFAQKFLC